MPGAFMRYLKSKWTIVGAILTAIVVLGAFSLGRGSTPEYFTSYLETELRYWAKVVKRI